MAQTVFNAKNYKLKTYSGLGTEIAASNILKDIKEYLENYDFTTNDFFSFIAVFDDDYNYDEKEFENLLWTQLQKIHEADPLNWDKTVSDDPTDKSFSFSILGNAFYIVGLHPNSSRHARKSPKPTLVFNLHWQFERLRQMKVYSRVRDTIRRRDLQKNGSVNPMLVDFGTKSEAPQYSGRKVENDWKCPFRSMHTK
jgi:FPC/CPF motif-containing protein YcgG